jgi:hypothetical protein
MALIIMRLAAVLVPILMGVNKAFIDLVLLIEVWESLKVYGSYRVKWPDHLSNNTILLPVCQ